MTEKAWDGLFLRIRSSLAAQGAPLPSVSAVAKEKRDPYRILVSTIISLRTKDKVTAESARKLFAIADTPERMLRTGEQQIAQAIFPAGFYQTKAKNIQAISRILVERYQGKVPASRDALLSLPGVGLKTANLTLSLGFGIPAICVDCHVHQIANRQGWVRTKTPEETERALRNSMPEKYWISLNGLLVTFGQYICTSVSPRCSACPENGRCPKIGVKKSR